MGRYGEQMTTTTPTKNQEFTSASCKFSVLFFKSVFKFLTAVCTFLKCTYQDYIFNRNYKRYLKYIDIYENLEEDDLNV